MPDGSFYDHNGYYFDTEGYDEFGGYYEGFSYVPGPEYEEEYYKKYDEIYGEEVEGDDEEYVDEDEYNIEDYFSESDEEESKKIDDLEKSERYL